jgi:hypothetical protein
LFKVKQVVCEWKLLPVRYEEPLTALLRFIGRVVVSEQKIETAQDADETPIIAVRNTIPATGDPSAAITAPFIC